MSGDSDDITLNFDTDPELSIEERTALVSAKRLELLGNHPGHDVVSVCDLGLVKLQYRYGVPGEPRHLHIITIRRLPLPVRDAASISPEK